VAHDDCCFTAHGTTPSSVCHVNVVKVVTPPGSSSKDTTLPQPPHQIGGWIPCEHPVDPPVIPGPPYIPAGGAGAMHNPHHNILVGPTTPTPRNSPNILYTSLFGGMINSAIQPFLNYDNLGPSAPWNAQAYYQMQGMPSIEPEFLGDVIDDINTRNKSSRKLGEKLRNRLRYALGSGSGAYCLGLFESLYSEVLQNDPTPQPQFVAGATGQNITNALNWLQGHAKSVAVPVGHEADGNGNVEERFLWKFIPSDINQRLRITRAHDAVTLPVRDDGSLVFKNIGTDTVAAADVRSSPSSIAGGFLNMVQLNQDCTCRVPLCSDVDKAVVLNDEDRSVVYGLLDQNEEIVDPWFDIKVSSTFVAASGHGNSNLSRANPAFYFLTPNLGGTNVLEKTIINSYFCKTSIEYNVAASGDSQVDDINNYVRTTGGPGVIAYVDHNDPILSMLYENHQVSADFIDLNINGILGGAGGNGTEFNDIHPRKIPQHMVIIPTSKNTHNPLMAQSSLLQFSDDKDIIERRIRFNVSPTRSHEYSYLDSVAASGDAIHPNGVQGNNPHSVVKQFSLTESSVLSASYDTTDGTETLPRPENIIGKVLSNILNVKSNYDLTYNYLQYAMPAADVFKLMKLPQFVEFTNRFGNRYFSKLRGGSYTGVVLRDVLLNESETTVYGTDRLKGSNAIENSLQMTTVPSFTNT